MHIDVASLVKQYEKHGWQIRRLLVASEELRSAVSSLKASGVVFEVVESDKDAVWFSRRSQEGREAWELRRLSGSPFALVAVIEDSSSEEERRAVLSETEDRMFDGSHKEPTSH